MTTTVTVSKVNVLKQFFNSCGIESMKMYFDTFAKHNPVNSEKYPRLLKENIFFLYICNSTFSQHKCITWGFSRGLYTVAIRHSSKKKKKKSPYQTFINHVLAERKIPHHSRALFMSLFFCSTYLCEQLLLRTKHRKNKIRSKPDGAP